MSFTTSNAAAKSGNLKLVKFLENTRCPRLLSNILKSTAKRGHLNILKWYATAHHFRANDEALYEAATYGQLRVVKWFFWSENSREKINKFEKVVEIAAKQRHDEILKWCLKYKCRINRETSVCILKRGDYELVKLLAKKAKYLLSESSAAMYAAEGNNLEVLKLCVENGAELEHYYPLSRAIKNENYTMVKWIIENGVVVDTYSLQEAQELENQEIYNYLVSL
jgi:ankyrin repeat protein